MKLFRILIVVFVTTFGANVFAAGDDLLYHEKQWDKRLQQYADQQS